MLPPEDESRMASHSTLELMKKKAAQLFYMAQNCTVAAERVKTLEDNVKWLSFLNSSLTQKNHEVEIAMNAIKEKLAKVEREKDKLQSKSESLKKYLEERITAAEINAEAL